MIHTFLEYKNIKDEKMSKIIVSKFGGTSMGNLQAMTCSAEIAKQKNSRLIVVSATSGTTNQLISIIKNASNGDIISALQTIDDICTRHTTLASETELSKQKLEIINKLIQELKSLAQGMYFLKDATLKAQDRLQSIGERLSSLIFTEVLDKELKKLNPHFYCETLDARDYIETDNNFTKSKPVTERILRHCHSLKERLKNDSNLHYVTQGFIGKNENGDTTTLGRGGSDYSASIFGEALSASEIQIWTDVAGIATTDPRICPDAVIIPELSFKEAAEMATFGAKILHPTTVIPARRGNIPVFVGSTFSPNQGGTWIRKVVEQKPLVRSINLRKDQSLITISNPRMLNSHGFLSDLFNIFSIHDVSVDAITTSEISVAVTIHESDLNTELTNDLEKYGRVKVEKGLSVVSIIGNKINHTFGLANKIFESLRDINVRMICQGASLHNFCILVNQNDAQNAVRNLHHKFITQ
jgi:aspartate kinase